MDEASNNTEVNTVFLYTGSKTITILPPGAQSAAGGFVNDHDDVAGTYVDAAGKTLGMIYHAGRYTHFRLPASASKTVVQAINNNDEVVGTLTDGTIQRVFVYTGAAINLFGRFAPSDGIDVALNNTGEIVVTDYGASGTTSYVAKCTGANC